MIRNEYYYTFQTSEDVVLQGNFVDAFNPSSGWEEKIVAETLVIGEGENKRTVNVTRTFEKNQERDRLKAIFEFASYLFFGIPYFCNLISWETIQQDWYGGRHIVYCIELQNPTTSKSHLSSIDILKTQKVDTLPQPLILKQKFEFAAEAREIFVQASKLENELLDKDDRASQAEIAGLYEESANLGNTDACYEIGCRYQSGLGVEENLDKAIDYYEKASEITTSMGVKLYARQSVLMHSDAMWKLIPLYFTSEKEEDLRKGFAILETLKKKYLKESHFFAEANYWLGRFYEKEIGTIEPNPIKAWESYMMASCNYCCSSDTWYRLGQYHATGIPNYDCSKVYHNLGKTFSTGSTPNIVYSEKEANVCFEIAAQLGHPEAAKLIEPINKNDKNYYYNWMTKKSCMPNEIDGLPDALQKDIPFLSSVLNNVINDRQIAYLMWMIDPSVSDNKDFILEVIQKRPLIGYTAASLRLQRQKDVILKTLTSARHQDEINKDLISLDCRREILKCCSYCLGDPSGWVENDQDLVLAFFDGKFIEGCTIYPSLNLQKNSEFMKQLLDKSKSNVLISELKELAQMTDNFVMEDPEIIAYVTNRLAENDLEQSLEELADYPKFFEAIKTKIKK